MGLIEDLAELALATRLHRLADRLQQDVSTVYEEHKLGVRARWFPLLVALDRRAPRSISDLARDLGLTHTAINQIATEMGRRRLLSSSNHPTDRRQRLLSLSPTGRRTVRELQPIWAEVLAATQGLLRESGHDMLSVIAAVEARLDHRSMAKRVGARLAAHSVEIVDFSDALAPSFRELNLAWIEALLGAEDEDRTILDDPQRQIIDRGGAVLFARQGPETIGTCALIRRSSEVFELAKMAVTEASRGCGIGRRLAEAALARAQELGARSVVLLTSPKLEAAIALYRSLGFLETPELPVSHPTYTRRSIAMRLELEPPRPTKRRR